MADRERLEYHVVDVFSERAFAGNPLAVVMGGEQLATAQMQAIASEFQLSETAFPIHPTSSSAAAEVGANYQLRIFTPDTELPFAGHPSIGTAWVLQQLGWFGPGEVGQLCGEGLLPLSVDVNGATLTGGVARVGEPIDPAAALAG
jgi:trans-2,3-dihydro-3-hydroxyanthranilate isomerase